jgi:hypothetical protein
MNFPGTSKVPGRSNNPVILQFFEERRNDSLQYNHSVCEVQVQLFPTRRSHTLVCETSTHDSQKTTDNCHDKTNDYRVKPSRGVGYRLI